MPDGMLVRNKAKADRISTSLQAKTIDDTRIDRKAIDRKTGGNDSVSIRHVVALNLLEI